MEVEKRRFGITLSAPLFDRIIKDIHDRGLTLSKSAWIELAIEHELARNAELMNEPTVPKKDVPQK